MVKDWEGKLGEGRRERASPMNGQKYVCPKCPARGQVFYINNCL